MLKQIVTRDDLHSTVLVTTQASLLLAGKALERDAICATDWHSPASYEPMKYTVSIPNHLGTKKFLSQSRSFVVNFMVKQHDEKLNMMISQDGTIVDLFSMFGLTKLKSRSVDAPAIKEAAAVLECEVENEIESGDHTIFVGKVLNARQNF